MTARGKGGEGERDGVVRTRGSHMKTKSWVGVLRNGEAWKLKFHGIVPTAADRRAMRKAKAEREKWNALAHQPINEVPRLVKR